MARRKTAAESEVREMLENLALDHVRGPMGPLEQRFTDLLVKWWTQEGGPRKYGSEIADIEEYEIGRQRSLELLFFVRHFNRRVIRFEKAKERAARKLRPAPARPGLRVVEKSSGAPPLVN